MINIKEYNRFNYLSIDNNLEPAAVNNIDKDIPLFLKELLGVLKLENVESSFTTDFDFFILIPHPKKDYTKNKYYGKPIYRLHDVLEYILSNRVNKLHGPDFYYDYLPMLTSKDWPTIKLGYSILLNQLSYLDFRILSHISNLDVCPFNRLFYLSYSYKKLNILKNCETMYSLFAASERI